MSKLIEGVNDEIEKLVGNLILKDIQNRHAIRDMVATIEEKDRIIEKMTALTEEKESE